MRRRIGLPVAEFVDEGQIRRQRDPEVQRRGRVLVESPRTLRLVYVIGRFAGGVRFVETWRRGIAQPAVWVFQKFGAGESIER